MRSVVRPRDIVSFLAFAAIIVFVLAYFGTLGIRVNPPADRTNLSMGVPDINGLVPGSSVLLRGVPVGKVTSVGTNVQASTVDFYVDGRYRIPVDSEVRLENLSALGESYIGLVPHSEDGPTLHDGQRISTEAVVQPPSISELATSVVRVLNQLNPGALERMINEGDAALPDPAAILPNLSHAATQMRNVATDIDPQGREMLSNFQTLLQNSAWVGPVLTSIAPNLTSASRGLQEIYRKSGNLIHRGEPGNTINLNRLLARVQGLLDDRAPDLKVIGQAFQPKLNAIAGALMNFDTGQLLDNMLAAVPADGTITLHVVP
jgi:virulence factor Mce-like protein